MEHFLTAMQAELEEVREALCKLADMIMTRNDQEAFDNAIHCFIYDERFNRLGVGTINKARDHYHISGK